MPRRLVEWFATGRLRQKLADGGIGESFFNRPISIVQAFVQRAEAGGVGFQIQWANLDTLDRVHRVDNFQDG